MKNTTLKGSGSEWHSEKMTRSSNRHGASFWHGGLFWHSNKMTRCVTLAQQQNKTMRHFDKVCHYGTEGHFGTASKCLSFNFVLKWRTVPKWHTVLFCRCAKVKHRVILSLCHSDTHPQKISKLSVSEQNFFQLFTVHSF